MTARGRPRPDPVPWIPWGDGYLVNQDQREH